MKLYKLVVITKLDNGNNEIISDWFSDKLSELEREEVKSSNKVVYRGNVTADLLIELLKQTDSHQVKSYDDLTVINPEHLELPF